jgi:HMG (high mobility group) box
MILLKDLFVKTVIQQLFLQISQLNIVDFTMSNLETKIEFEFSLSQDQEQRLVQYLNKGKIDEWKINTDITKRPENAFFIFRKRIIEWTKQDNITINMKTLSKLAGRLWKNSELIPEITKNSYRRLSQSITLQREQELNKINTRANNFDIIDETKQVFESEELSNQNARSRNKKKYNNKLISIKDEQIINFDNIRYQQYQQNIQQINYDNYTNHLEQLKQYNNWWDNYYQFWNQSNQTQGLNTQDLQIIPRQYDFQLYDQDNLQRDQIHIPHNNQ